MADVPSKLLDLAKTRFDQLCPAEEKLFEAAGKGAQGDCLEGSEAKGVIRSERLSWHRP